MKIVPVQGMVRARIHQGGQTLHERLEHKMLAPALGAHHAPELFQNQLAGTHLPRQNPRRGRQKSISPHDSGFQNGKQAQVPVLNDFTPPNTLAWCEARGYSEVLGQGQRSWSGDWPRLEVVGRLSAQGSGFRVQGSGFRVQGSGFRVQGSGCRVQSSGNPPP